MCSIKPSFAVLTGGEDSCKLITVPIIRGSINIDRRANYRRSRQRERLLELLRDTGKHPTADWLYERLKGEFPHLSLGTVYRNLTILLEQGLVKKIDFGSTYDRFEALTRPHYHFVCESCGSISDLEIPVDESLNERVNRETPFIAHRHRIEFFGICDECKRKKNG